MGSRYPSHQLSNGLYVSGPPGQPKKKPPAMSTAAMPYTGGDIKKSGELGKMLLASAGSRSGTVICNSGCCSTYSSGPLSSAGIPVTRSLNRQQCQSGPLNRNRNSFKKPSSPKSGGPIPMVRQNSNPIPPVLPVTGLITSGSTSSSPLNSSGAPRIVSGPLDSTGPAKPHSISIAHNQAVTKLSHEVDNSFKSNFPKTILWALILLFLLGFVAGGFIFAAVQNAILLIAVAALFGAVAAFFIWNACWGRRAIIGFIAHHPDVDLRTVKDGQYIKVSGVVTCGNIPLKSSFQKAPRCVYTSTSLYEYRGWNSKAANPQHRHFTWGLRLMERHVVDFYISDFQSGLRALVKTGYGARVTPYVDESVTVDINPSNKNLSPEFLRWLGEKNLSSDDRVMRMKEGYIKEGSTVSVMGVVQRTDNVLMILPPSEPISTGYQWAKCIIPSSLEGIVLRSEDTSEIDVIQV